MVGPRYFWQALESRLGKEITLHEPDATVAHGMVLLYSLNSLRDHGLLQRGGERDDGFDDSQSGGPLRKIAYKLDIELEVIDGQLGEKRQAGVPGPEVVKRDL